MSEKHTPDGKERGFHMKKNKKVLVLSGLLVLAMIAGVLAYFNKTTTINNPFSTKSTEERQSRNSTPAKARTGSPERRLKS